MSFTCTTHFLYELGSKNLNLNLNLGGHPKEFSHVFTVGGSPPKSNIDTKNDVVLNVYPFKYAYFVYSC